MIINVLLIGVILVGIIFFLIFFFREEKGSKIEIQEISFDLDSLTISIREKLDKTMKINVRELNLNQVETLKVERQKRKLKKAYKNSPYGNIGDKNYIKDYIKEILQRELGVNELNIDQIIPFSEEKKLGTYEKFLILLFDYKKKYKYAALKQFILDHSFDQIRKSKKEKGYFIDQIDIDQTYRMKKIKISFLDKLEIISQLIYERNTGNSVIDEIRDMEIDGISGGVSGIPTGFYDSNLASQMMDGSLSFNYDSIWIFFQGKPIHLRFLSFGSEKELQRVCKNIYRFGQPGQLSATKGAIINQMADGSRVVVTRPNLTESWAFFIRKFDNIVAKNLEELSGNKQLALILKAIVKGCQVTAITGMQGCGKTTLLKSMIGYINPVYTLRVQELEFELWLRKLYPKRNILTFRETDSTKGEDALELQRKTDGAVNILGEVVSDEVVIWLIKISQVASRFTMFTHHAKTTKKLIDNFRNALLAKGGYGNERIAEEQVVDSIRFDVHMEMTSSGDRYIERITEIIPCDLVDGHTYRLNNIVQYQNGSYIFSQISEEILNEMSKYLTEKEVKELKKGSI